MMTTVSTAVPGVRREDFAAAPAPGIRTGVPAFVGHAARGPFAEPVTLARAGDFAARFGEAVPGAFLAGAVEAFFRNGGERCVVARVEEPGAGPAAEREALRRALASLASAEVDLVCAPDLMRGPARLLAQSPVTEAERAAARATAVALQQEVLAHCDRAGDRLAILDALPGASPGEIAAQQRAKLAGTNGALYAPWLVPDAGGTAPPCGYVAGVFARTDRREGVHRAPTNEPLMGVLDVEAAWDDARQAELFPLGVNAIRAFPGRGVRVWGARTLSADPAWTFIPVRRVFLTLRRWLESTLPAAAFEPHGPLLWARIGREVAAHLEALYRRGALKGATPAEAFYVRCDESTNPPEERDAGRVVTEVGLAPAVPNEFVIVRFTHGPGGSAAA